MALSEVVMPYLDSAANQSWRGSLLAYRSQMQTALDALEAVDMPADWRINSRALLQNNIAFMDAFGEKHSISIAELPSFARHQAPMLKKNIAWAAQTQVEIGWGDERSYRETLHRGDAALIIRRKKRAIAGLRLLARLRPSSADRVQCGAGFDPRQRVDNVRVHCAMPILLPARGHATCRFADAALRTQPSAGATISATSSIDRRMKGCGGSIECD